MSRKIIKVVPINELRGVIVDSKKWHGKKLFRAFVKQKGVFDDPLYTYLRYEDGKYDGLQDDEDEEELPEELQVNYDYYDQEPEMEDVPRNITQVIREEQIENFRWLNSILEKKLDMKQVIKWINQIPIKTFNEEIDLQEEGDRSLRGYFDPRGFIAYNKRDINQNTYMCKVLRFHEFIHYIQFMLGGQREFVDNVMSEAYTESLALRRFAPDKSTVYHLKSPRKPTIAVFNFPAESYKYSVSLLRQMEVLLGRDSFCKDFTSYKEFAGEFIKKYGEELYTYLTVRMEMLEYNRDDEFVANKTYFLSETQDKLMKEVFRRDFDKMKTMDDAKKMLERLRKLEPERVTLYEKNNDGSINQLGQYEEYYERLLSRIAHKLLKRGYTKEEIIRELEQFEYVSQPGNPVCTEEEFLSSLSKNVDRLIIRWFNQTQGRPFDPDNQKIVYALYSNGDKLIGIRDKKTRKLLAVKGFVEEITHFCYGDDSNNFTEEDIDFLTSPEAPEFRLPKRLYLKYKNQAKKGGRNSFSDDNEGR